MDKQEMHNEFKSVGSIFSAKQLINWTLNDEMLTLPRWNVNTKHNVRGNAAKNFAKYANVAASSLLQRQDYFTLEMYKRIHILPEVKI